MLVACGIFVTLGVYWDPQGFRSNILAELAGMCLGIAVATLIVDRVAKGIQEAERVVQQRQLHDSLSHLLGFLVEAIQGNPFHWSKHAIYSEPLSAKFDALKGISAALAAKSYRMNVLQEKCVIESSHEALDAVLSLSSVAFQISGRHGLLWLAVNNSVGQLARLFPFQPAGGTSETRVIIVGQDTFSLNFCELVEHMLMFEAAKAAI